MTAYPELALTDVFDVFNFKFCLIFHLTPVERTKKTTLTNGFIGSYMKHMSEILSNGGYKKKKIHGSSRCRWKLKEGRAEEPGLK